MMPIRGSLNVCVANKKRLVAAMLYSWSLEPELSRPGSCSAWAPNETVTGRASINTSQYNNKEGDSKKPYTIYYYTRPPGSTSTVTTPATTLEIGMRFEIRDFSFIHLLFSVFTHPPGFSLHSHFTPETEIRANNTNCLTAAARRRLIKGVRVFN